MSVTQPRVLIPVSHPLGGIRTYMLYNLKRLHEEGFRFTFLSEAGEAFEAFKKDVAAWDGTEFVDAPEGGGSRAVFFATRKALKHRAFTLIHSQGLKAGTITAAAAFRCNVAKQIPQLITLHDVIVPGNEIPGRFKTAKKAIISFLTRRASVLIPVTEDCRENHLAVFPAWKNGPVRIETIANGVDVEKLLASKTTFETGNHPRLRKDYGIEPNAVLGGFFGRFMPQKGFDLLAEAMALLAAEGYGDRFRLVATKDPNGFLHETIRDAMENHAVGRMVRFIEPVPDIAPLLCQTDLLVMPSRWEACGLLAMEAMVLGKPVVGSDCLGLREVLAGTPSFAPKHDDVRALASALIEFIEHPTTMAAINYADTAAKRFDIRIATEKLLEIYRRFV